MYNRQAVVTYAQKWWDGFNPEYPRFSNDCTNFVSQCLRAGTAPMWGEPNREKGWWVSQKQWSLSWSTSHSLRWYLAGSTKGLTAREVQTPQELDIGDVIVYDFENDGRMDHAAIVTNKRNGEPLVSAHTIAAYDRYWDYRDSPASTDQITYIFYKINDQFRPL